MIRDHHETFHKTEENDNFLIKHLPPQNILKSPLSNSLSYGIVS